MKITSNGNMTITDKNSPNFKNLFVSDDYISKEELLAFQNEFIEMIQYAKNYLNFIMKRVKKEENLISELIIKLQQSLTDMSNRITKLEEKKTNLIKDILRG